MSVASGAVRSHRRAALALLLLAPLLASCASDDGLKDAPYDAIAAGDTPPPSPRPEETKKAWEDTFLSDLAASFDEYDRHGHGELVLAGYAACGELGYDYGDGSWSGAHRAIARVSKVLGEGDQVSYEVVEVANRHLCEWSHLAEDGSMELPPLSDFSD